MLGRLLAHPRNRSLSSLHGPFLSSWSRSLSSSVTSFPTPPGEVRRQLQALSPKMTERVFFYHEKNPHIGILENIKYHIYNYYSLLGPLKTSWYPILKAHPSLGKILAVFLHRQDSSISYPQSLHSIASLLDSLENKKGVSSCKLEYAVRGGKNLIRFKQEALTNKELIVLQTLAKYGYYNYEIV